MWNQIRLMEDLPMPEWKNSEDTIFASVEKSGAVELCVEEMITHMLQDENLTRKLADELMQSPEARDILENTCMSEENGGDTQGNHGSASRVLDAVYDKLVGIMGEDMSQLVSETVWNQLDPKQGHPPASFLSACVRDATLRYYVGRAPYPDLKNIPAIMIESGGVRAVSEDEKGDLPRGHYLKPLIYEAANTKVNYQGEETMADVQITSGLLGKTAIDEKVPCAPEGDPAGSSINADVHDVVGEMMDSIVKTTGGSEAGNSVGMGIDTAGEKNTGPAARPVVNVKAPTQTHEESQSTIPASEAQEVGAQAKTCSEEGAVVTSDMDCG